MQTYLKWLTRLLVLLAIICAGFAAFAYTAMSPDGHDGGGGIALLYAALVGAIGFGFSALATFLISINMAGK